MSDLCLSRAGAGFDADDQTAVTRRRTTHQPAILVIEDLDSLLKTAEVSTFLDLIDKVESSATGGPLLMATTNKTPLPQPGGDALWPRAPSPRPAWSRWPAGDV